MARFLLSLGALILFVLAPLNAVTAGPWRRYAWISGAVAASAAAVALWAWRRGLTPLVRRLAVTLAALAAGLAIGAGSETVANKPEAITLWFGLAVTALGAGCIQFGLGRSSRIGVVLFVAVAYLLATRLDPVIVDMQGTPLPRYGPFAALVAGAVAGSALALVSTVRSGAAIAAAALCAAFWSSGFYGVALAGFGTVIAAGPDR